MTILLKQDNVILRTGVIEIGQREIRIDPEILREDQFGMVLIWDQVKYAFLKLRFEAQGKTIPGGNEAYQQLAESLDLAPDWRRPVPGCAAACIFTRGEALVLSGTIDTNHPTFCDYAQKVISDDNPAVGFAINVMLLAAGGNEKRKITIALMPATEAPAYQGYVGLDLGNHNSTIAAYSIRNPDSPSLLKEPDIGKNAQIATDGEPVLSTFCYRVVPQDGEKESIDSIHYEIGDQAKQRSRVAMHGIELAAKRLAASPNYQELKEYRVFNKLKGKAEQIDVRLPKYLAAELLACRMLNWFREGTRNFPAKIAVSYPSTYSEREVRQLREVLYRAWLRCKAVPQSDANLLPLSRSFAGPAKLVDEDEGILLMLDEASAAAFFFLCQKILSAPGKRSRFRYLYPNGLNLLLFDCGGGTTDIALVRALVRPNDPRKLVFTVRGRVGHRQFGGDYITEAVFKLLKAKAAKILSAGNKKTIPAMPGATKVALEIYLKKNADKIDAIIPTKTTRQFANDVLTPDDQERLNRAMNLWRLAEETKIRLAEHKDGRLTIDDTAWEVVKIPGVDATHRAQLSRLMITRDEVDALVQDQLSDVIKVCNKMIFQKLVDKRHTGMQQEHDQAEEVHWVVAAGAASRYPLIPEMLREHLNVPFIKSEATEFRENRMTIDQANMKNAVAKGLARVLMTMDMQPDDQIEFDSELSQRLPFEVSYEDSEGHRQILFRENTHTASMTESRPLFPRVEIDAHAQELIEDGARPGQNVKLHRRAPGEVEYQPYLMFQFREGVEGDLRLRYEQDMANFADGRSPFIMTNETTHEEGECHDLTPIETYQHPVQRGDL